MSVPASSRARLIAALDESRALVVVDRRRLVATLGAYEIEISMPGDVTAPAVALIDCCVLPDARGKGHLRSLVTRFLSDARERGEPLSVLNTDELTLYPRFGFGIASYARTATLALRAGESLGTDRTVVVATLSILEAREVLPSIFEAASRARTGEVTRTDVWWGEYFDEAERHGDATTFRVAVLDGAIDGYAVLQRSIDGARVVAELVSLRPEVARGLICSALDEEVPAMLRFRAVPEDLDVASLVGTSSSAVVGISTPQSWLRIVDVEAGLLLRRYGAGGDLSFFVEDETAPWNRSCFRLRVADDGVASVTRTEARPELFFEAAALATVFSGARSASALANEGSVRELSAGALSVADEIFHSTVAPFCSTLL